MKCPKCNGQGLLREPPSLNPKTDFTESALYNCPSCKGTGQLASWSPIRCPHCGQLHEQPDAERTIKRCGTILQWNGHDELLKRMYAKSTLTMQAFLDMKQADFLHTTDASGQIMG